MSILLGSGDDTMLVDIQMGNDFVRINYRAHLAFFFAICLVSYMCIAINQVNRMGEQIRSSAVH